MTKCVDEVDDESEIEDKLDRHKIFFVKMRVIIAVSFCSDDHCFLVH